MKFNREQIEKALQFCGVGCELRSCTSECPYFAIPLEETEDCCDVLARDALALIKELTEENERFRYEHRKLIEECDTFKEYAYKMQIYIEYEKHKEEDGYEPSAARYAAEMDMWRVVALEKKKLTDENERLNERLDREAKCQYDLATKIVNLRDDVKYIKEETVQKMQEKIRAKSEYGTINISPWQLDQIAKEMLED